MDDEAFFLYFDRRDEILSEPRWWKDEGAFRPASTSLGFASSDPPTAGPSDGRNIGDDRLTERLPPRLNTSPVIFPATSVVLHGTVPATDRSVASPILSPSDCH